MASATASTVLPVAQSLEACFQTFTVPEVLSIVGEVVNVPRAAKRSRRLLFEVLDGFPADVRNTLKERTMERVGTKRKAADAGSARRKRRRVEAEGPVGAPPEVVEPSAMDIDTDAGLLDGPFMEAPSKAVTNGVVANMLDRFSNTTMAQGTCMVCARNLFLNALHETAVPDIPNPRHLVPHKPHPAHKLVGPWLLHEEALHMTKTYLCSQCRAKLVQDERPPLALSNNMWIGAPPFELTVLTLPERVLIARYLPAAYINAQHWENKNKDSVNNGLRGNIAGITSGNTMPPSPNILAATIGNVPLRILPDFLRVRRDRVFRALVWLKENNGLYANIEISESQLRLLPENAVPEEIIANARHSTNVAGLQQEQADYVPVDVEDEDNEEEPGMAGDGEEYEESDGPLSPDAASEVYDADVIPMQAHGVVDVHGHSVPDSELLAHALSNVTGAAVQGSFYIRKSSAFVNEYPRRDEQGERYDGGPENPNHLLGAFPVLFPYGMGGLEVDRPVDVPYETHVRWALEYADRRFRTDLRFIFQTFGVIQKRNVLAGQAIDLEAFVATAGPDRMARAVNIAKDPFAAAQFFHLTVTAILEDVFGITANKKGKPQRKPGVVGLVNGYIGTVEAQGRGSLHLHILLWLDGAPSSEAMRQALETEDFRRKVTVFLKETIRADIQGTTAETVMQMKKQSAIEYSRPVDPRLPNYELRRHEAEAAIARTVQVHSCKPNTCLQTKGGRLVCKRRAPWPLSTEEWIHPNGEWGPRRVLGRMNAWNPPLLQITRANQDMKIVTHGHETKDIAFYITMYVAKKQNKSSNASALLAKSMAFQRKKAVANEASRDINKLMIQQCANTLSREQELSGPEVVSYLMGWGDRFISHNFVPIYWDEVTSALRRQFPALEKNNEQAFVLRDRQDPRVRLRIDDGGFVLKDQLKEYTDRGEALEDMSYLDYHVNTYDGAPLRAKRTPGPANDEAGGAVEEQGEGREDSRRAGRPASQRVPYLATAKRKGQRVIRNANLETLPHFIGSWFPRQENAEYYSANMLALLKPWRRTFRTSFDLFMTTATVRERRVVQNVNYFYEPPEEAAGAVDLHDDELDALAIPLSEADVVIARNERYEAREYSYAHALGIFESDAIASWEDTLTYAKWETLLRNLNRVEIPLQDDVVVVARPNDCPEAVLAVPPVDAPPDDAIPKRTPIQQARLDRLNTEQRRAHDIIEQHKPEQLLMIVRGEGGTGKTVLLNAISDTFETATTVTTHTWAAIPVNAADNPDWAAGSSAETTERRKRNILPAKYVNIDECSMLTKRQGDPTKAFGGANFILFGDFHQFPPIGAGPHEIGNAIYQQFTTVVTLTEQLRVIDIPWLAFLRRLRVGDCSAEDMDMLNSLLVTHPSCELPDVLSSPWNDAVLVTPRHAARVRWNTAAVIRHSTRTGNRMYICEAEDTVGREEEPLNLVQRVVVAGMTTKQTGRLADRVELSTEADLANGTRGELAITPAYAFTDYKSQGQTIQYVYIDLEPPPRGKLTPFSAYVALSRSRGRDHIRLLRGFDPDLFTTHPNLDLAVEDARLDRLTARTKALYA
ncbi:hypothetical protein B0H12DRAFT_1200858 [Mycena haematopus]|nr:hypothetical protein B0H12DRAFT_1200858 [Mycena haematopus]